MIALSKYCEVCGEEIPLDHERIGNRCMTCEKAPAPEFYVGRWRERGMSQWTPFSDAHDLLAYCANPSLIPEPDREDLEHGYHEPIIEPWEAEATINFIVELVNEIKRLQEELDE